jgi:hypothetical protein
MLIPRSYLALDLWPEAQGPCRDMSTETGGRWGQVSGPLVPQGLLCTRAVSVHLLGLELSQVGVGGVSSHPSGM